MFKLGLCSVTFRDKTVEEIIELSAKEGLEGIEWGADVHVKPGTAASRVKEIVSLCRKKKLAIPSYGSYFNVLEHQPADFAPILDTAALLGADTIRVWAGWVKPKEMNEEQFGKITSTSREIAAMAAAKKIRVAFEFHDNTPTEGADGLLKVLKGVNHPNLYTYWQLIRPTEFAWNLENLERVYSKLTYIHVQANDGEKNLPLEDFNDTWKEILSRLKKKGYEGWLFFEFNKDNSIKQLAADIKMIKKLM